MQIMSTYKIRIKDPESKAFSDTARLYRDAVDFYIVLINDNWDVFANQSSKSAVRIAEQLSVVTKNRPSVKHPFSDKFYKFPSYLRRAAIAEAQGKVSSYRANLSNWESSDPKTRGSEPGFPKAGLVYPAMYKGNCFVRVDDYTAKVKVFIRNTWDWVTVHFRKSDADYIIRHCPNRKECVPTLQKRHNKWYLDFAFEEQVSLNTTDIFDQTIVAVDLGINNACTCSVMRSDGTVLGRHFLKLPKEYDSLNRKTSHIKRAQRHGSRCVTNLWKLADSMNHNISVKTASFIEGVARMYDADVIVFEHLDTSGKKRGSKKQRLALWRKVEVQHILTGKAHRLGMRISRICAWGTSRFAYDGSGRVLRGKDSKKTGGSYSICEFQSGKVYNCDLNASYNIGARYFVREILKSLPATDGQHIGAKVPQCAKRSTCTLATLINLNSVLYESSYNYAV